MRRWFLVVLLVAPATAAEPRLDADGVPLPDGCLARLGSTRFRTWPGLDGPTVTDAGELLFTEHVGGAVHVRGMDAATGLFVRKSTLFPAAVAGSPGDGRSFVGTVTTDAKRGEVDIVTWDLERNRLVGRVPAVGDESGNVKFSQDRRWAVRVDGEAKQVVVTETRTGVGRRVGPIPDLHGRSPAWVAPDGGSVLVATDAAVGLFDVRTGRLVREVLARSPDYPLVGVSARFSPDGAAVVVGLDSRFQQGYYLFDARTNGVTKLGVTPADGRVVDVGRGGAKVAFAGRGGTDSFVLHVGDGRRVPVGARGGAALFDPTGERFVVADGYGVVVRSADTGRPVSPAFDPCPTALRFSADGRTVTGFGREEVLTWEVATARPRGRAARPADWTGDPSPDGRTVFAEPPDGGLFVADTRTGGRAPVGGNVLANATKWEVPADGRTVVTATTDRGGVRLAKYALTSGEPVGESQTLPIRFDGALAVSADGDRVAVTGEAFRGATPRLRGLPPPPTPARVTQIFTFDLAAGDIRPGGGLRNLFSPPQLRMTPDGTRLLVLCERRPGGVPPAVAAPDTGGVFDLVADRRLSDLDHGDGRAATAVSPNSRLFAVGGRDGTVRVVEAATGGVRATFRHKTAITAVALAPDGGAVAAASEDAPVYLWDLRGRLRPLPPAFGADAGDALWDALADPDAGAAFEAMQRLAAAPDDAAKLFARKSSPAAGLSPDWVADRVRDLTAPRYADRERATADLQPVVELIRRPLEDERAANPSPEAQRRLRRILSATGPLSPSQIQVFRAVEVLEWAATPAARAVLATWAGGLDRAPMTVAARQALARLGR